jgi:acyl-CoA thioesterase
MNKPESMAPTPFTQLLLAMRTDGAGHAIALPSDWLQGRTAYGGLSAALCLEATLRAHGGLPPLRSAQFCFIGPATGVLRMAPKVLRQGKSTVVIGVDLDGDSGLAVRATFCFGASRTVAQTHGVLDMPAVPAPEAATPYFTWPDRPNFMSHFDGRLAQGAVPGTPGHAPEMTVWLRHHDPEEGHTLVRLLSLADALPPPALVLYRQAVPISTMTWAIDFLDDHPQTTDGWWLSRAVADTSCQGYSAQGAVIWNREGRPTLIARQNVAIFG